jgi:hypothetical protein
MLYTCDTSTQETEIGRWGVQDQPGLPSETLSQKSKTKQNNQKKKNLKQTKPLKNLCELSQFLFLIFLLVLEFELRTSCLLGRQVLYHLNHIPSPFCFIFADTALNFCLELVLGLILLSMTS